MKRINKIQELHKDDTIWSIDSLGSVQYLKFFCTHPNNYLYSIFITLSEDPIKVYNGDLLTQEWYLYESDKEVNSKLLEFYKNKILLLDESKS